MMGWLGVQQTATDSVAADGPPASVACLPFFTCFLVLRVFMGAEVVT